MPQLLRKILETQARHGQDLEGVIERPWVYESVNGNWRGLPPRHRQILREHGLRSDNAQEYKEENKKEEEVMTKMIIYIFNTSFDKSTN